MSLANKYRPKKWEDVVGQDIIVEILKKQIERQEIKNCYLFCGERGVSKTTCARILANEINNNEGEPIELDCASNNGVDNIRQIITEAQQMSIDSKYKVFILDECGFLTSAAWSAALKLIEEPPKNTIFIFCTTDPQRIPMTILSRVQRFDFKLITREDIANRLEYICKQEQIQKYEKDALLMIADKGRGSMRDAITLLEESISYSRDITVENIIKVFGIVKEDSLYKLTQAIIEKNEKLKFEICDQLKNQETNHIKIIDEWIKFLVECAKVIKTKNKELGKVKEEYKDYFITIEYDILGLIDRILKLRYIAKDFKNDDLLDLIVLSV